MYICKNGDGKYFFFKLRKSVNLRKRIYETHDGKYLYSAA